MDQSINLKELEIDGLEAKDFEQLVRESLPSNLKDTSVGPEDIRYMTKLMEELLRRYEYGGTRKWFMPDTPFSIENCPKHQLFFNAGKYYQQRAFIAANRSGKSVGGAFETACHLTGEYPDWWDGYKFERPTKIWACGKTAQTTRDTVQKEMMGSPGAIGTGMIPADKILNTYSRSGTANAMDTVLVKSKYGVSALGFKSYDQALESFVGVDRDVVWLDEECPADIYNECLIRLMTTNGILYTTFTPLNGVTEFIISFDKGADHLADAQPIYAETRVN